MNLEDETSLVEANLELPTAEELRPYLAKLIANPGSAIVIGIELHAGAPRVGRAWLNRTERQALRKALERVNASRAKRAEKLTTEEAE